MQMHKIKKYKPESNFSPSPILNNSSQHNIFDNQKSSENSLFQQIPSFIKKIIQNAVMFESQQLKQLPTEHPYQYLSKIVKNLKISNNPQELQTQHSEMLFFHQQQKQEVLSIFSDISAFSQAKTQQVKQALEINPPSVNQILNQQQQLQQQKQKLILFIQMKQMQQKQEQIKQILQLQQKQQQQQQQQHQQHQQQLPSYSSSSSMENQLGYASNSNTRSPTYANHILHQQSTTLFQSQQMSFLNEKGMASANQNQYLNQVRSYTPPVNTSQPLQNNNCNISNGIVQKIHSQGSIQHQQINQISNMHQQQQYIETPQYFNAQNSNFERKLDGDAFKVQVVQNLDQQLLLPLRNCEVITQQQQQQQQQQQTIIQQQSVEINPKQCEVVEQGDINNHNHNDSLFQFQISDRELSLSNNVDKSDGDFLDMLNFECSSNDDENVEENNCQSNKNEVNEEEDDPLFDSGCVSHGSSKKISDISTNFMYEEIVSFNEHQEDILEKIQQQQQFQEDDASFSYNVYNCNLENAKISTISDFNIRNDDGNDGKQLVNYDNSSEDLIHFNNVFF